MGRYTEQVSFLIPADWREQINDIHDKTGASISVILRTIMRHGLPLAQREARRGKLRE